MRVLDAGPLPLTTVQDLGRPGHLRYGIPPSGPMDRLAFVAANRLVGNADGAAGLECALVGPRLEAMRPCAIAVTGADMAPTVNGERRPRWTAIALRAGDQVRLGPAKAGMRAYVAFSGGIDVPPVLGSRATYMRGQLGGLEGRALRKGDTLRLFDAPIPPARRVVDPPDADPGLEVTVRVVLGPEADRFTEAGVKAFLTGAYELLQQSDRMGARLRGPRIAHARGHDIISNGIALGTVQVPGDGQPIVLLVDRQSAGGYTKIATVCSFDIGRLAQQKPGRHVRFQAVDVAEAHRLLHEHRAATDRLVLETIGQRMEKS
ncbi:MAG: biotin-dependent carboxyltransferase [Candidatus Rokubacteria bacterium]|nr:biotin-dependent carboxyltransferase [Candidatus Rokubacteria bacterium]